MPKCTAQLHSLNLVNRMDLSKKSDLDVQSVGYKSVQSPTILCWLSPSLSIVLDDSCITQNATACPGHDVFGRVCSRSLRTTNIHTKTKSQHFNTAGMGT